MGLFDTIRATLPCPVCGSINEREIQTKKGPCALFDLEVGDTLEPFFYGDYWLEEDWDCDDCRERTQAETRWHKSFIHCINGLIVEVTPENRRRANCLTGTSSTIFLGTAIVIAKRSGLLKTRSWPLRKERKPERESRIRFWISAQKLSTSYWTRLLNT